MLIKTVMMVVGIDKHLAHNGFYNGGDLDRKLSYPVTPQNY